MQSVIEKKQVFSCPDCASSLEMSEGLFTCGKCRGEFPEKEGIPVFGNNTDFFFWDIPKENMEEALEKMEKNGWREAILQLQDSLPRRAKKIWSRTCNTRRWPWIFLLPVRPEARVLDLGCGWGNNSVHLAPNCKEVYSMDTTFLHLKLVEAYAKHENIKNIIPVHGGDRKHLPFRDGYFDIVAMNGVFEWVGRSFPGDPNKSQQMFLNEIKRVLKPDGSVYIGIENRLAAKYFRGSPEGHIKMRFGALLPRPVTRFLLKVLRKKDFKVYTYSMAGYRNMLKRANMDFATFLAPVPNYSLIAKFMPICASSKNKLFEPLSFAHSSGKQAFFMNLGGANFVSGFSILASGRPMKSPLLRDILARVLSENFGWSGRDKGKVSLCKVKPRGRIILKLELENKGNYFLKIDTAAESKRNVARSAELLKDLRRSPAVSDEIKRLLPEILTVGEFGNYVYLLEREAKGRPGGMTVNDRKVADDLSGDALGILKELHKNTAVRARVDEAFFKEHFEEPLLKMKRWMKKDEQEKYGGWFANIEKWLRDSLMGKDLPLVCRHGDFVPSNCMIDRASGRISKVLDWEFSEERGLPLLDLVSFMNRILRADMNKKYPGAKFPGYPEEFFAPDAEEKAKEYTESLKISKAIYKPLVFMWWVKHLEDWYPTYGLLAEWKNERIFPIAERWNKILY